MSDSLLPREPFAITPDPSRAEPAFWVRRLSVVDERTPGVAPRRLVEFRRGLNVVRVAERPEGETRPVGHSVGKTLLTRLIRYCLGEKHYAREEVARRIKDLLPAGHVIAEVVVQGTGWVVVRPFAEGARTPSLAGMSDDWRDGLDSQLIASPYADFEVALAQAALGDLPALQLPDAKRPACWFDILGWLSRDQECNFSHYNVWRSRDSGAGSPELKRPDASVVVQWALGLLDSVEADLRAAHQRLLDAKEQAEKNVRQATSGREASLRVLEERFPDLARDEEDSLVTTTATTEARQKVGQLEGLLGELMEGAVVAEMRKRAGEIRIRQRDADTKLAELKATILVRESQAETEKAAGVGDIYGASCLCPAKPAACPRSDGGQQATASSARQQTISRLEADLDRLRSQREEAEATLESVSKELAEAEAGVEQEAAKQLDNVKKTSDLFARWQTYLGEITSYEASRGRLASARQEVQRLGGEIERSLDRQRAAREGQRHRLDRLSDIYSHVLTRLSGQAGGGVLDLDARGARPIPDEALRANGQAMASLAVLGFDLACLVASVVGAAPLPSFLIHDSPKTSDLEAVLYARLYDLVLDLLAAYQGGDPSFQYIVTTTTPPPAAGERYNRETLHGMSPEGRLLRAEF